MSANVTKEPFTNSVVEKETLTHTRNPLEKK
jgi:hypothetical protein